MSRTIYWAHESSRNKTSTHMSETEYMDPDSMMIMATDIAERDRKAADVCLSVCHIFRAIETITHVRRCLIEECDRTITYECSHHL